MRAGRAGVVAGAVVMAAALLGSGRGALEAQGGAGVALTGVVSSQDEPKMEGVLVIARRDGANFTTTVVSDAQGRYSFPRTHLVPGTYSVTTRVTGMDLAKPATVDVPAAKAATLNLKIEKSADLAAHRSSLEWAMSLPGTPEMLDTFMKRGNCNYCHTYKRILSSKHTAEQWPNVIRRMTTYYPDGSAISDDNRGQGHPSGIGGSGGTPAPPPREPREGDKPPQPATNYRGIPLTEMGSFLASVNLSGGKTTWSYPLKSLPRPSGKATRVIVTQWDIPRSNVVSHDMTIDSKGIVWYADETSQTLGRLDPRTSVITEYPMPPVPKGHLAGTRDVEVDADDNVWVSVRVPGGAALLSKFEPATQKLTMVDGAYGQFIAVGAGKAWINVPGSSAGEVVYRVDPTTMKVDKTYRFINSPITPPPGPYQMVVDSKGNPYVTSLYASYIVRLDGATGTPTYWSMPGAGPRRGRMDSQDRFWFAQNLGDKIGMLDTRTEKFSEWPMPHKWTNPYAASVPDKNGYVYVSSNMAETLNRLDPKTGEVVSYLMPTNFDTKKIVHDPSTSRVTLYMSNVRNARIVRVEPLD